MIETTITNSERFISWEKQLKCSHDGCEEPATNATTDAVQTETGWTESPTRRGCDKHPVTAMCYFLGGRVITWEERVKELNAKA